jgi:hypothetical protein
MLIPGLLLVASAFAREANAAVVTQNSLITQDNADYLYWQAEAFDRAEAPLEANLWRVNFNPPAGTIGTTVQAPSANDTAGANDSYLIYRFQFTEPADYFFYAYRAGGNGDSMFLPSTFNVNPTQTPQFPGPNGNAQNRWNSIADNTWSQLGVVGDYPATGYFATNAYTYRVTAGDVSTPNILEFRIEAREALAQYDRFALHKTSGLTAAQLNALTFSATTVQNPVQPPPPSPFVQPPNAPAGGPGFFGVREVINNGNVGDQSQAYTSLQSGTGRIVDYQAPVLNIQDSDGSGNFLGDNPFQVTTLADGPAKGSVENISLFAQGVVRIPTAGTYTFGVNSDDGFTLLLPGQNFQGVQNGELFSFTEGTALRFFGGRGAANTLGQITLPAGDFPIYLTYHEGNGGSSVELFAAQGSHTGFNESFSLVGAPTGLQLVPEPTGVSLLAISAAGLLGMARRRRKA